MKLIQAHRYLIFNIICIETHTNSISIVRIILYILQEDFIKHSKSGRIWLYSMDVKSSSRQKMKKELVMRIIESIRLKIFKEMDYQISNFNNIVLN